ncbi:HlyD family type I secretion periplasmic adaptor subunit [Pararhizobium sp. IMCC21322]|uniref:HlyD family type I secretion periplasmic adaptor subunit n=1 Tax=Pararhizobium sp. IMCC21322 TaxID=3067903 RepID=UPI0027410DF5|nr:HlyD family type I secretion periplasmic adaptor subunit [Pararhizobium sp. IMCC21322]
MSDPDTVFGRSEYTRRASRLPRRWSSVIMFVTLFMIAAVTWAALAPIDEISRAEGRVIPSGKTQVVQSGVAGVVADIFVRTGQQVKQGQVLVRLDDTTTSSSAGEVEAKVRALSVQVARLRAEVEAGSLGRFVCPPEVAASAPEICANEESLQQTRAQGLQQSKDVLERRIEQRQRELNEALSNLTRLNNTLVLASEQLSLIEPLAAKQLVAQSEILAAQRDVSELTGQIDAINETVERLKAALSEADLQSSIAESQFREQALTDLTQRLAELTSAREVLRGAADQVTRTEIRSPVNGIINNMGVNTIGAFIAPGDRLLDIVPVSEKLLVEARLKPSDVAFILPGQSANIKLTAYDFSVYGGLEGHVENVSPDSIVDPNTRETYYIVLLSTDQSKLDFGGQELPILPGMVTNVEILTGKKTVLQFILKPINKARNEALRER